MRLDHLLSRDIRRLEHRASDDFICHPRSISLTIAPAQAGQPSDSLTSSFRATSRACCRSCSPTAAAASHSPAVQWLDTCTFTTIYRVCINFAEAHICDDRVRDRKSSARSTASRITSTSDAGKRLIQLGQASSLAGRDRRWSEAKRSRALGGCLGARSRRRARRAAKRGWGAASER